MTNPSIDVVLQIINSKFLLVNIVSKRVDEMVKYNNYQLDKDDYKSKQLVGKALEELVAGKIVLTEK